MLITQLNTVIYEIRSNTVFFSLPYDYFDYYWNNLEMTQFGNCYIK